MKRILVTGAGGAAATNFIRSLRLAPEPFFIVGTDANPFHLALSEADRDCLVPPSSDPDFLPALNRIIEEEGVTILHPQPDTEVFQISLHRQRLAAATLLPSHETIALCQDKLSLVQRLQSAAVPVAPTFPARDEASLAAAVRELLDGHDRAWLRARRGAGSRASLPVTTPEQAGMWVRYWESAGSLSFSDFMVSEYLPGREFAFQSIWQEGEIVTSQGRERLEYLFGFLSPSGQSSSPALARTVHRPDVNEIATAAVKAVSPKAIGVFCVDLKENAQGVPCVTEINAGRFFTTSNFLAEAGCNMPYYYIKLAFGEELPPLPKYDAVPEGLHWVRLMDMGHRLLREGEWDFNRA